MLRPITINFIFLAFGVINGAYLPLALIYLVSFFRRERFGFSLIWKAAARLAVITLLLCLILAALGATPLLLGLKEEEYKGEASVIMGFGFLGSFFVGIILFIIGLVRGRSRVVTGSAR
jgi:hypothetical protein